MRTLKIFVVLVAAIAAGAMTCKAQSLKISERGATVRDGNRVYVIPSTTISVCLTIRHESVRVGEYARFAQRNLGVIAPLADRDIYIVDSASIAWGDSDTPLIATASLEPKARNSELVSHVAPSGTDFARVLPDNVGENQTAELAARSAATTIFDIRKARLALMMEPMEGAEAALQMLDRTENQYLELFLGKQSIETYTVSFDIVPEKGRNTYVVCRINPSLGILPKEDLSGEPILLEMRPEGLAEAAYSVAEEGRKKRSSNSSAGGSFVVADMVECTVTDGTTDYAIARIPVYQFGLTVSE